MLLRQRLGSAGGEGEPLQVRRGVLRGQDQDLRRHQVLLHVPTPQLVQYSVSIKLVNGRKTTQKAERQQFCRLCYRQLPS